MEPPAREGVVEGVPGAQSLDRYLAILSAPGVPPADRALAYAVLHQVQLRINRRLRPVRDELVEHMVRENMSSMGLVTLRSTSIDPAWPANEPGNWTDAMVQDALTALAADPTTSAYVRRIPAHLEIDKVALGAGYMEGDLAARALYHECQARGWRTEAGRRLTLEVKPPAGVTP